MLERCLKAGRVNGNRITCGPARLRRYYVGLVIQPDRGGDIDGAQIFGTVKSTIIPPPITPSSTFMIAKTQFRDSRTPIVCSVAGS